MALRRIGLVLGHDVWEYKVFDMLKLTIPSCSCFEHYSLLRAYVVFRATAAFDKSAKCASKIIINSCRDWGRRGLEAFEERGTRNKEWCMGITKKIHKMHGTCPTWSASGRRKQYNCRATASNEQLKWCKGSRERKTRAIERERRAKRSWGEHTLWLPLNMQHM